MTKDKSHPSAAGEVQEMIRTLRHYTESHRMVFPTCGAPTPAKVDAAFAAPPAQPGAVAWRYKANEGKWGYSTEYVITDSEPLYIHPDAGLREAILNFAAEMHVSVDPLVQLKAAELEEILSKHR